MPENILVIVVDGLRASALGAYGNTSFPTPTLDRLAAQSLLMDWCYAPSPELGDIYEALWRPVPAGSNAQGLAMPKLLANAGYHTTVVTDDPLLRTFSAADEFDEIVQVGAPSAANEETRRSSDVLATNLAQTFSAAIEIISNTRREQPRMFWLHTRGMYGAWDAPLELQNGLRDDEDPEPIDSAVPPDLVVSGHDPDTVFRYACAYGAQVMAFDQCLDSLLDAVGWGDGWVISLMGARGFPLGEHGRIGGIDERTYAEQMHAPWLLSLPNGLGRMARASALTSHRDLLPTLAEQFDRDSKLDRSAFSGSSVLPWATSSRPDWRESVVSASPHSRSIRTASWCLREDLLASDSETHGDSDTAELYVRPDDRWEANDVAKLCPDVIESFEAT